MQVNLSDLIEAIEFENDMLSHYYNKDTGVIIYKEDMETASYFAEDIDRVDSMEEWEKELIEGLYDLKKNPENYIKLPDKEELNELKIMINFCSSFSDIELPKLEEFNDEGKMLHEVKNIIRNKGLINEWYDYREYSEREIVIEWCKKNNIQYIE